ncbi:unnamed protein product [Moneuplotes crassus]|uniref:Uncharacterized protein n=1 Tax=Euplotes crassus TaxID=5936 RepID=A0AAD1UKR6_EUPCR|nr:unnamed protein product [Moneuplotes crassus]
MEEVQEKGVGKERREGRRKKGRKRMKGFRNSVGGQKRRNGDKSPYVKNGYKSMRSLKNSSSPSKRNLKAIFGKGKLNYLNETGPGDYEAAELTGSNLSNSNLRNSPKFSFGTKLEKTGIITKKHIQESLGIDSPGVGVYDTLASIRSSKDFTMGKGQRFQESSTVLNIKRQVPHSYLKTTANLTLTNWKGAKLGKGKRFTNQNPFYKGTISPGPRYNIQNIPSLTTSQSRSSLDKDSQNSKLFGAPYSKYKNVYFHEFGRDFCNREGPGPAFYQTVSESKGQKFSFPKGSRKLSSNISKSKAPSPTSYRYEKATKLGHQVCAVFGKGTREVDFSKYASQNSAMIEKGIY